MDTRIKVFITRQQDKVLLNLRTANVGQKVDKSNQE